MKLVGIVGTNAKHSYNRMALQFMKEHFKKLADIEVLEIKDLPAFNVDYFPPINKKFSDEEKRNVWLFKQRVQNSDGVIWACPEYNHAIPAVMKSAIEWLSFQSTILDNKPSMIIGCSWGAQASSRAQEQIKQILAAPSVNALSFPGHEVLIGNCESKFQGGTLVDEAEIANLETNFTEFLKFVDTYDNRNDFEEMKVTKQPYITDAYVNFPTGKLSLEQLQAAFNVLPFQFEIVDAEDKLRWFSDNDQSHLKPSSKALDKPINTIHPIDTASKMEKAIREFKANRKDMVQAPYIKDGKKIINSVFALRSASGNYLGAIRMTGDVDFIFDMFKMKSTKDQKK